MKTKANSQLLTANSQRLINKSQKMADGKYVEQVNAALQKWSAFLDTATRSTCMFTLVAIDLISNLIARFRDKEHYPEYARFAVREGKVAVRRIEQTLTNLKQNCAPQLNSDFWTQATVNEAKRRYLAQGVSRDYTILTYTLSNHLHSLRLNVPPALQDLYMCIGLVRMIDINADVYARTLIDLDPVMADIINVPKPSEDPADKGHLTPLHLLTDTDNELHLNLRRSNPQVQRELSYRRFALTRPLREAITAAAKKFFPYSFPTLPASGQIFSDNSTQVGTAVTILLNRANKTDFIHRATEPRQWDRYDEIERDYLAYLDDNDLDNDEETCRAWKMQSEACGEWHAAQSTLRRYKAAVEAKPEDYADAAQRAKLWAGLCTRVQEEWTKGAADARKNFDIEREATARLHPDWTADKVERAVEEYQYNTHERSLSYDVEALRHHLEAVRPKGVTKKALKQAGYK